MKEIILTKNQITIVDDDDFEMLSNFKWFAIKPRNTFYACTDSKRKGVRFCVLMHRMIMKPSKELMVDHIDGNGLNNQKNNLRLCTNRENVRNTKRSKSLISIYKGIYFDKRKNKWSARITKDYKGIHLGVFDTEIEAAIAYNTAARDLFGEFASLNPV